MEEAKKRIYACSTTTYNGFQVEMTEEMSEKFRGNFLGFINPFVFHFSISHNLEKKVSFSFRSYGFISMTGLPGVVFILPDSYLYPETKEYGGILYFNTIYVIICTLV